MAKKETPEYRRSLYLKYREKRIARAKAHYQMVKATPEYQLTMGIRRMKRRQRFTTGAKNAKARGYEWSITWEQYLTLCDAPCDYCGESTVSSGHGLDRVDSLLGYSRENVVPCCKRCNRIKCNYLSRPEMQLAMAAVLEYRKNADQQREPSGESKN